MIKKAIAIIGALALATPTMGVAQEEGSDKILSEESVLYLGGAVAFFGALAAAPEGTFSKQTVVIIGGIVAALGAILTITEDDKPASP